MFNGFSGRQRVAPIAERRTAVRLREALAALPAPWIVLASRRSSGADGPPWVRFLVLHPEKGIALVDIESAEAAVAPLEDFLARTGFAALRAGTLPIVPVAVGVGEVGVVAELLDAALATKSGTLGNPNWCEAVVELLLGAPDLMLAQLRRAPSAARRAAPAEPAAQTVAPRDAIPEFPLAERMAQPPRWATSEPPRRAPEPPREAPPPRRAPEPPRADASPVHSPRHEPSLSASPARSEPSQPHQPTAAEPPRLVPRRVEPRPPESESARLVPRRVAPATEESREMPPHEMPRAARRETPPREPARRETPRDVRRETPAREAPPRAATPFGDDRLDRARRTPSRPAADTERTEPRFGDHVEPQFALMAGDPIIPLRQTATSRRRREPGGPTGALRPDSALTDWQPRRHRRWPYAAAAVLLLGSVGAIAVWYREAPPPQVAATGNVPSLATVTPSTPAASSTATPQSAPTAPLHAAATPQPATAPHATAADLPRAMLQPKIASSAPPLPLPLPEAKLTPPEPVRTATTKPKPAAKPVHTAATQPKPESAAQPMHTAATPPKPAAVPRTAAVRPAPPKPAAETAAVNPAPAPDHNLPAPIAAVLYPVAAAQRTAPAPASTPPAPSTHPPAAAPAMTALTTPVPSPSASAPPGTVTVNGVTYVNGEQPHSLGSLYYSSPAPATSPAPVANAPAPAASALGPNEVVISRAPGAPLVPVGAAPSSSGAGANSGATGAPQDIVISRAPAAAPPPDAPPPGGAVAVPSNAAPPYATVPSGTPQSIQSAPLSGSSP
jgi:hypothetical protein